MNIKITHKWLLDYLETDATPNEIQKYLSLCGPSVETVEKTADGDYVYDIEITSNRIDSASVYGIALECQAILPMFGKKAVLKHDPLKEYTLPKTVSENKELLDVSFLSPDLCSRFAVAVFDGIQVKPSPDFIRERLQAVGIKVINNVVDISNYLMVTLGQPTHVFDYDKVKNHRMIMRESRPEETITTLDEKQLSLPGGDIVIEDGSGDLIDLCGIMGGLNSSFTEATKRVILFVQTYNKAKIRRTSMLTGQRTIAATYFEKGLDEERITPTLSFGMELIRKYAGGHEIGNVIDIRSGSYNPATIRFSTEDIDRRVGVPIPSSTVTHILESLGFPLMKKGSMYEVMVPSFRRYDVAIIEDIVEEVARIYGYHNLPNNLSPACYVRQPEEFEKLFTLQTKVKTYLKHLGLHEVLNYSMISAEMIEKFDLKIDDHLKLANVLSEDIKYLRTTLLPSLIKNLKTNEGRGDLTGFFELAKTYLPRAGDLPVERYYLALAATSSYADLKGILEGLMHELNIRNVSFPASETAQFGPQQSAVTLDGRNAGRLGQLKTALCEKNALSSACFLAELDFQVLMDDARSFSTYTQPHPYSVVKLDLTYTERKGLRFEDIQKKAFATSEFLDRIELISRYENKVTLRFYFSSSRENVTEDRMKSELDNIRSASGI